MYGVVSADFKDKNNDGGNEDVDEHHLHATVLDQLQHLKSATTVRLLVLCSLRLASCVLQRMLIFLAALCQGTPNIRRPFRDVLDQKIKFG